jgi:hypothetical protein
MVVAAGKVKVGGMLPPVFGFGVGGFGLLPRRLIATWFY